MKKPAPHLPPALRSQLFAAATCIPLLAFTAWPTPARAEATTATTAPVADAYPQAASKKGLQVELIDDALALGIKHAAININLSQLIAPNAERGNPAYLTFTRDGRTFSFHRATIEAFDNMIKPLSSRGVLVNLIVLVYQSDQTDVDRILLHPKYDRNAPNRLSAFNAQTPEGREWLAATMEFLAQRWSRPDQQYGRVVGYIIGNEVNSHSSWSNMGRVPMREFADNYLAALRIAHGAVRAHSAWARVYVSLEHHWTIRIAGSDELQAFPGKDFIDYIAKRSNEDSEGNFDWHIAFHPYPENLFEPRFWKDTSALPTPQSPRITFKNLDVLTDYLKRPELLYQGKPRRVILSEQGFHTPDGPDGEAIQAAAYCYAYRKVAELDGIDAFILHRHVDHPFEGGLRLGLRRNTPGALDPRPKKLIYDCFLHADQPDWEQSFSFALPIIGIKDWADIKR